MIHVIFVIGRVFDYVELSNTIQSILLSNDWSCHLILHQFVEEVLWIAVVYVVSVKI